MRDVSLSTVKQFEHSWRKITPDNLIAIRNAFAKTGIVRLIRWRKIEHHAQRAAARVAPQTSIAIAAPNECLPDSGQRA
jgi:hypothetical protein